MSPQKASAVAYAGRWTPGQARGDDTIQLFDLESKTRRPAQTSDAARITLGGGGGAGLPFAGRRLVFFAGRCLQDEVAAAGERHLLDRRARRRALGIFRLALDV